MQCAYTHYAHAVHVECTHCAHTRTECTHCAHIHAVHTNTLSTHTRSAYTHTECTHTVHTRSQSAHTHSLHMPSPAHSLPGPVCVCAWARAHPWHIVCTRAHPPHAQAHTPSTLHTPHCMCVRIHTHTHTHAASHPQSLPPGPWCAHGHTHPRRILHTRSHTECAHTPVCLHHTAVCPQGGGTLLPPQPRSTPTRALQPRAAINHFATSN